MSIIAITMNLLLMALLLAALGMGWTLNRRLKVLRDSHEGFAKAVSELNGAAKRAETGLADLKSATDEASQVLSDRIQMARDLAGRLEQGALRAPAAAAPRERAASPTADRQPLTLGRPTTAALARPRIEPGRAATPTARRPADDDLFDDEPLVLGGRR